MRRLSDDGYMPKANLAQEIAAAQARVAELQRKALARNRELAALPKKFGYETPSGLLSGIIAAQRALSAMPAPAAPAPSPVRKSGGSKKGVKAKAKPAAAAVAAPAAPAAPADAPAASPAAAPGLPKMQTAVAKAAGQVERVKVTPELKEKVRELTAQKKTVSQISAVTGLGVSTLFRLRAKMGIKVGGNQPAAAKAGVVAKAKPAKKAAKKTTTVKARSAASPALKTAPVKAAAKPAKKPAKKATKKK